MFIMNIYTLYFHILLKELLSSVIPVSTPGRQLNLQKQSLLLIHILGFSNKIDYTGLTKENFSLVCSEMYQNCQFVCPIPQIKL